MTAPLRDQVAEALIRQHFDGTGCMTHDNSACSNCHGPSPMSAYEIADVITALVEQREREVRAEVVDDLRWLADARQEYDHRDPEQPMTAAESDAYLVGQHEGVRVVASILTGHNDAIGWLPSWRWDDWSERQKHTTTTEEQR